MFSKQYLKATLGVQSEGWKTADRTLISKIKYYIFSRLYKNERITSDFIVPATHILTHNAHVE